MLNEGYTWVTTRDEWQAEKAERCTRAAEAQRTNTKWQESLRCGSALVAFALQEREARLYNEVELTLEWVYGMEMDEWWRMGMDWTKGFRFGEAQAPGRKTSGQEVERLCGLTGGGGGGGAWVLLQVAPDSTPTVKKKVYYVKLFGIHLDDCAHLDASHAVQILRSA